MRTFTILLSIAFYTITASKAQQPGDLFARHRLKTDTVPSAADNKAAQDKFRPSGKIWVQVFADALYKPHADSARRGTLLYSGSSKDTNAFDLRRVFLGCDYSLSERFSTELVIAHEGASGLLTDGTRGIFLRLANIRWKNIYKRADLIAGLLNSPAFSWGPDKVWGYRAVERTLTDQRGLGKSVDGGFMLQGTIGEKGNIGYNVMAGNGSSTREETDKFKKLYADVYFKFLNQRLLLDLYADFERSKLSPYHSEKTTARALLAYQSARVTAGVEVVQQGQLNATTYFEPDPANPGQPAITLSRTSSTVFGVSVFARGTLLKDRLYAFGRFDRYDPDTEFVSENFYSASYKGNVKESFITAGIDYSPYQLKSVRIIPNIWYNQYHSENDGYKAIKDGTLLEKDHDLVYRLTIHYTFR